LKHGILQGSIPGHLLIIIYTNDFPLRIKSVGEAVLFADDTRVIISSRNFEDFSPVSNYLSLIILNGLLPVNFEFIRKECNEIYDKEFITFYTTYCL
jgi:hypothetical protein